jgi:hypothetical protein
MLLFAVNLFNNGENISLEWIFSKIDGTLDEGIGEYRIFAEKITERRMPTMISSFGLKRK